MGRGLFFWCARWPGGAGFAGTADIASRCCLKNGCETYWSVLKNFASSVLNASPRRPRYLEEQLRAVVAPMRYAKYRV